MPNYVTLSEAASYLGVSKSTLRNWDKEGKLVAVRNPVNKYRTYDLEKLLELKKKEGYVATIDTYEENCTDPHRLVVKLSSIIRDEEGNSNIIERFDEMTKLLYLKLRDESNVYVLNKKENGEEYANRIRQAYLKIEDDSEKAIKLKDRTIFLCGVELSRINIADNIDIKGLVYEEAILSSFDENDNQQFFTPRPIVDFIVSFYKEFEQGNVCDPACGTAGFLIRIDDGKSKLFGFEIDPRLAWISKINLIAHNKSFFTIKCLDNGGSLGPEIKDYFGQMDLILTNPPFGSDYSGYNLSEYRLGKNHTTRRRGILFIEQAFNLLKEGGHIGIIIDDSVLNSQNNVDVRHFILDNFEIESIISLPETTFMPYATVNSSILFMKKTRNPRSNHVFFAKSENVGRKPNGEEDYIYNENGTKSLNSDLDMILDNWKHKTCGQNSYFTDLTQNLKDDESLRLDFIYNHPFRNKSQEIIAECNNVVCLSDICIERNESFIPSSDSLNTTIPYTGLADIEPYNGKAVQNIVPSASIKSSVKRYEPGDIVFSRMRPNLRKIAVMNFSEGGYVSPECCVLTLRKKENGDPVLNPQLLSTMLRSDLIYGQIMHHITGIGRPRISIKDIRQIKIPIEENNQDSALIQMQIQEKMIKDMRQRANALLDEASRLEKQNINEITLMMAGL